MVGVSDRSSTPRPAGFEVSPAVPRPTYLTWHGASDFGWGIAGLQNALHWCCDRRLLPIMSRLDPADLRIDPLRLRLLEPALRASAAFAPQIESAPANAPLTLDMPVVHAMGSGAHLGMPHLRGTRSAGRIVFENTRFNAEAVARLGILVFQAGLPSIACSGGNWTG
jgi:hypothetical protein